MSGLDAPTLVLFVTALFAAAVNGGLGFGFSTLTVPVALAIVATRVLNPALVLLEVLLNFLSLLLNRRGTRSAWRRTLPLIAGLLPGVLVGSVVVAATAAIFLKAATYAVLLPLVLVQFFGGSLQLRWERLRVGLPAGFGVGVLYATTTISGPPLALLLGSGELSPDEFRGAMAVVRLVESTVTLVTYSALGLVGTASLELFALLLPAVAVGAPLGRWLLTRLDKATFRRVWLSVDTGFIAAGLAMVLTQLGWVTAPTATALVVATLTGIGLAQWLHARRLRASEVRP